MSEGLSAMRMEFTASMSRMDRSMVSKSTGLVSSWASSRKNLRRFGIDFSLAVWLPELVWMPRKYMMPFETRLTIVSFVTAKWRSLPSMVIFSRYSGMTEISAAAIV